MTFEIKEAKRTTSDASADNMRQPMTCVMAIEMMHDFCY